MRELEKIVYTNNARWPKSVELTNMTPKDVIAQAEDRFDEKYFDKNTPSGLNQKDFKSFPEIVKDIRNSFLSSYTKDLLQARDAEWEYQLEHIVENHAGKKPMEAIQEIIKNIKHNEY
jgi:hypothetical protein